MKRKLVCLCEYEFEQEIPESVDLSREPHVEQDILDGEFLTARCPNCGKLLKPELPVLIRDPAREVTFYDVGFDRMSDMVDPDKVVRLLRTAGRARGGIHSAA